jgi:SAM-dependent methyltransferase
MSSERAARARSFASVADAYERARPGYPDEAVRWLLGERPLRVVDVGAGTGKLTRQLVAAGHDVVAIEPLPEMLDQLRRVAPGVRALAGSAEAIPLPDESVDAVTAAQAFHWFDHGRALPEIARVLRPQGALALIWNVRDDSVEWIVRLNELLGAERIDYEGYPPEIVAASALFGPTEHETFVFEQRVDRVTLRELVLSRSYVATLEPAERERLLGDVERAYDDAAEADGLVVPYVTHAFRTLKRSPAA